MFDHSFSYSIRMSIIVYLLDDFEIVWYILMKWIQWWINLIKCSFAQLFLFPHFTLFFPHVFFQENKINQRECRDSYGQAPNVRFKRITEEVGFDGDTTRRHAKTTVDMQKGLPPSTCQKRLSPSTCKKYCLRRHAKNIVSVDMQKIVSPSTCKKDCLRRHAKKMFPSTCKRRLSPSTCKKNLPVDMQKEIVSVDMPKNVDPVNMQKKVVSFDMPKDIVFVDMPTEWSSMCQHDGVCRHGNFRCQRPWSCLRRHTKGFCPSMCRPHAEPPPRMAESFVNKSVSHLCPRCVLQRN